MKNFKPVLSIDKALLIGIVVGIIETLCKYVFFGAGPLETVYVFFTTPPTAANAPDNVVLLHLFVAWYLLYYVLTLPAPYNFISAGVLIFTVYAFVGAVRSGGYTTTEEYLYDIRRELRALREERDND